MRNPTREIDSMLRDGKYTVWNLPSQPYTPNTVEHWLRYHYSYLQAIHDNGAVSGSDFENDLHLIWIDLDNAIKELPHHERQAIDLLIDGYNIHGKKNIAWRMGLKSRELRNLLNSAYKCIADTLEHAQ